MLAGLKTLQGFERVGTGVIDGSVQVINNLLLPDYSGLSRYFSCRPDGTTSLDPSLVMGIVAAHPVRLQSLARGCSLTTLGHVCQYIRDDTRCPQGTEYYRTKDNTLQYIESSDYAPSPAPSDPSPAPSPSRSGLPVLQCSLP